MKVNRRQDKLGWLIIAAVLACFAFAPAAGASSKGIAWWSSGLSMLSLEESTGGGTLDTRPVEPVVRSGLAYDSAKRRFYWTDVEGPGCNGQIAFAHRRGGKRGVLETSGASVCDPRGPALDLEARRVYWANSGNDTISWANLDGSGGGDLNTAAATVDVPTGVALDPLEDRVYWASAGHGDEPQPRISYANLDGSGGGDLDTAGAPLNVPDGIAVDPIDRRIYWANTTDFGVHWISYAALDGSGGGTLNTTGATFSWPAGVALDPVERRIYWGDGSKVSYADLDGSGGADLDTGEAPVGQAAYPVLFDSPPNRFKVGEPTRRVECRIPVTVPGAGEVALSGKGLFGSDLVDEPETERVRLGMTRKIRRKLRDQGHLDVRIKTTYTPLGGTARTKGPLALRLTPYLRSPRLPKCRLVT